MQDVEVIPPWYRQFWPWFIISILVFAVVIGLGLLFIALANQDSMVRDNYYKEGRAINMHLGRDHRARDLGLQANFSIDTLTGEVSLTLDGQLESMPQNLRLDLISPTHADRDMQVDLYQVSDNLYAGQLERSLTGRVYVDLSDPQLPGENGWRLTDELQIAADQQYRLMSN
ncbi:FixH family protein [Halopseudomonas yangmingensis]|uniref:Nitrogen fixation protein FixH n=1 Tax=Halopseudomonas yangmingensis TaxID=1720063 RepID=A0A1I4UJ84_9GAMM|nr:FixH family protein [Halopseudomonas yangmingensis]SFM88810.1 hypothetical protein SAMN05216217_1246 [Halopseudomonas yangmingensis]